MSSFQRKPATVDAAQLTGSDDLTLADGTVIPAGHWVVVHADGKTTAVSDADFRDEYEPATTTTTDTPVEAPSETPVVDVGQPGAV